MQLKFEKICNVKSPIKAHNDDAGIDFFIPEYWNNGKEYLLAPGHRILIPSGIKANVPKGYVLVAHNKSGISNKYGLDILACVIDSGYQGEVHISLVNTSNDMPIILEPGTKIVQFILIPTPQVELMEVLPGTLFIKNGSSRGENGFGSTGEK